MAEPFEIRRATAEDSAACWELSWASISDLAARQGNPWSGTPADHWPRFSSLYGLLAETAAEWWVAEDRTGRIVGYARSVKRGPGGKLFELAELFVRPDSQSAGLGRDLLERAFPDHGDSVRVIIATTDVRAISRYHRAGTSIQFPIMGMTGTPRIDADEGRQLAAEPMTETTRAELRAIERHVLEYPRSLPELRWLARDREGYLYRRDGASIGFGFVSATRTGPIAARDPAAIPDILRHVEARAAALGAEEVGFEVPAPNVTAIRHLLDRGFRFDPFYTFLMSSRSFGRFDRYIGFSPPFVL